MPEFFEFETPRQLLEKAEREFAGLEKNIDGDKIFNFFVTAYHVCDYVTAVSSDTNMDDIYSNRDFKMCQYVCNKSKHHTLTRGQKFITYSRPEARLGAFVIGESALGLDRAYFVYDHEEVVDVIELGRRIISLWQTFLTQHGL